MFLQLTKSPVTLLFLYPLIAFSLAPATGNFGISTPSCFLSQGPLVNPPALSTYLADVGRGHLSLTLSSGLTLPLESLFSQSPPAVFPACEFTAALSPGLTLAWSLLAPLSPSLPELAFLPTLLGRLSLTLDPAAAPSTASHNVTLAYALVCGSDEASRRLCGGEGSSSSSSISSGGYSWLAGGGAVNASGGGVFVGASGGLAAGADCGSHPALPTAAALCASLTVEVSPSAPVGEGWLVVGYHSPAGRYAPAHPTPAALAAHALAPSTAAAAHHAAFLATLPALASPEDSEAVRWWLQSPLLLTKGLEASVLTMGYVELNQRDSFWTTMLHAHLWPELESAMLQVSCANACSEDGGPPSFCQPGTGGKIPTCVLPTIVRDDNVDITAFLVLRAGRAFAATGNESQLASLYPCLRNALHYLQRRCPPGTHLPAAAAESYWGSWLDVPFMRGRRLMADNSAVYLAAQRVGAQSARLLAARAGAQGSRGGVRGAGGRLEPAAQGAAATAAAALWEDAKNFSAAFTAGLAQLLQPVEKGGQWETGRTGGSLVDTWHQGIASNYSLGDQFMACFFGLLDANRATSLLRWMTKGAGSSSSNSSDSGLEGPFGVRALFPYLPHATDPWGGEYSPGVYANGGSYAWLTCGASLALAWGGERAAAARVWRKLSRAMLLTPTPEHVAYEYLHSDSGARMGNAPQGWDGVCAAFAWLGGGAGGVHWWRDSPVWAWPPGGVPPESAQLATAPLDAPFRVGDRGVWHAHTYRLQLLPSSGPEGSSTSSSTVLLPLTSLAVQGQGSRHFVRLVRRGQEVGEGGLEVVAGLGERGGWDSVWPCSRDSGEGSSRYTCRLGAGTEVRVHVSA